MKKFIVADGGGTKTKYLLLDENKEELASLTGPGTNPVHIGIEAAKESLRENILALLAKNGTAEREISEAALFVPVLWRHCAALEGFAFPCAVRSDTDNALWAALGADDGLVLLSGTGSFVRGRNRGAELLVGGWGSAFGDEGSGYALGISALRHCAREYDMAESESALSRGVKSFYGISSVGELKAKQKEPDMLRAGNIAALCPVIERAAKEGCPSARSVIRVQAIALAEQARICAKRLGFDKDAAFRLALTGGVLTHNEEIRRVYMEILRTYFPKANIYLSSRDPIEGAKDYILAAARKK